MYFFSAPKKSEIFRFFRFFIFDSATAVEKTNETLRDPGTHPRDTSLELIAEPLSMEVKTKTEPELTPVSDERPNKPY